MKLATKVPYENFYNYATKNEIMIKETPEDDFIRSCDKALKKEMDELWAKSLSLKNDTYEKEEIDPFQEGTMFYHIIKGEESIGTAILTVGEVKGSIWLSYFYLLPKHRNKGYGEKALQLLKQEVKHKGYKVFAVSFISDNLPAKKLYNKIGFNKLISETAMMKL